MFKKRSKKALSHVDWAMSLGIFLLYLAWFFIFVKPLLTPAQSADTLLDILEDGVEAALFEDTHRLKVNIPAVFTSDFEPVAIPFTESWAEDDISMTADYFVVDSGKMFFLANLSNATLYKIYHPLDALTFTPPVLLVANDARARSGKFSAHFDEYLLDHIMFNDEERLEGFSVEVDDFVLADTGSFTNWTFLGKYLRDGDYLNVSSYVFAENSRVYTYITPNDYRNHSVEIDLVAYNYTYYYFDELSNGELRYRAMERCSAYESDFLDLYDESSGMLVAFSKNVSFLLCMNETNPRISIEFDSYVGEDAVLYIVLHDGDVDDVRGFPPHATVGVVETLNTMSAEKISLLKNSGYDYLKQVFSYPVQNDFNITVTSDVVDAAYGTTPPALENVYARKLEGFVIDSSYEPQRVFVTLSVW